MAVTLLKATRQDAERIRQKYAGRKRIPCAVGRVRYHRDPVVAEWCCQGDGVRAIHRAFAGLARLVFAPGSVD